MRISRSTYLIKSCGFTYWYTCCVQIEFITYTCCLRPWFLPQIPAVLFIRKHLFAKQQKQDYAPHSNSNHDRFLLIHDTLTTLLYETSIHFACRVWGKFFSIYWSQCWLIFASDFNFPEENILSRSFSADNANNPSLKLLHFKQKIRIISNSCTCSLFTYSLWSKNRFGTIKTDVGYR